MRYAVGIDVGSTHTKAAIVGAEGRVFGTGITPTGFRLQEAAGLAFDQALENAGLNRNNIGYIATTGFGRTLISFRDVQATDLTAQAWGTRSLFPRTRTVLDVGGQTVKAMRLDERGRVRSFRLNDKCAAGTGAFLEKTAHYLGYGIEDIGPLAETSERVVPISGVCAVFAESEVINHVSQGAAPADIMQGAMVSLIEKSVRLMKRVQMEPEFTLVGGIMRFPTMVRVMRESLGSGVNVPPEEIVQFTGAIGAAILAARRREKLESSGTAVAATARAAEA